MGVMVVAVTPAAAGTAADVGEGRTEGAASKRTEIALERSGEANAASK